jgi:hypothetical protein
MPANATHRSGTLEIAKHAADSARKAVATCALISFLSLLVGDFIASAAAAFGGHERDEHETLYATNIRKSVG